MPDNISGHPDHVAIGKAATSAFEMMAKSGDGPRKLYYVTIPASSFVFNRLMFLGKQHIMANTTST
ncbi:hypothetical protein ACFLWG_01915 [Chloroflexota bacterium]